jgi:hypothetical protein
MFHAVSGTEREWPNIGVFIYKEKKTGERLD